ncbi:uncharacterized protein C6orf136-like [Paramacrobiotus metropolitanus]|uniref:uncharacterized protein C6orf136-like n=1 Tax=Paramacrobiotus metropolitanus TaxID=2943436 RepID=UPI00244590FC|nr:uncharacterized protein C6orf136-like [Paramacrobiotus metropolitanus]XP_055327198.1 uncharacterized protein C6orf136-like [Paramacrobiotus metropolitanus]
MAIRYAPKLVRYYRRAVNAKRRTIGSYIAAYSSANSHFPIRPTQGRFIGAGASDHYKSFYLSSFRLGSLDSFDLYVNDRVPYSPVWTVSSDDFYADPSTTTAQYLSQIRSWETIQSYHAHFLQDCILKMQPQAAHLQQPDDAQPKKLTEEQERANRRRDQLREIAEKMGDSLPDFFTKRFDYSDYSLDVVFENRIRGLVTKGLKDYALQLNKYKSLGHIIYAHIKLDVLKITEHPEDNTVRVRWRITMIGGLRPFLTFWRLWTKQGKEEVREYLDGFSTFVIGEDGKIHKHIADKMMPDDEKVTNKMPEKLAKLAAFVGFIGLSSMD